MKKIALIVSLCALMLSSVTAQTSPAPQPATGGAKVSAPDLRQETFDVVWRTVKEKHFDPTLGGVDWDKVRER
ncbi:MAG TPA: hypothetical protein VF762_15455, partial [Blastocatellia bacterium]